MQTSNLLNAKFKTLGIKMFNELMVRVHELRENFNSIKKDMETIKRNQLEIIDTLIKMKNNLQRINSRVDAAKDQNSDLNKKKKPNQNRKNK